MIKDINKGLASSKKSIEEMIWDLNKKSIEDMIKDMNKG